MAKNSLVEHHKLPRENSEFLGHQACIETFRESWISRRLHHAWLLSGPKGVGKATLAYRLSRFLLLPQKQDAQSQTSFYVEPSNPVFARIASGGHSDLITIELRKNEKTGKMLTEIAVQDVRRVSRLVSLTPGEETWRIIIIDGVEKMNASAANAILKHLEEPPAQTIYFLINQTPSRILPTIRSRCRLLAMKPLSDELLSEIIDSSLFPGLSTADNQLLVSISNGSPGKALALGLNDGIQLYNQLTSALSKLPDINIEALHRLSDEVINRKNQQAFYTLLELIDFWLTRTISDMAEVESSYSSRNEDRIVQNLLGRGDLEYWCKVWEKLNTLFAQAKNKNLEPKQVLLTTFNTLQQAMTL